MSCSKNVVSIRQLTSTGEQRAGTVVRLAGDDWMGVRLCSELAGLPECWAGLRTRRMMKEHNLDKHKWHLHKCSQRHTGVPGKANTAWRLYAALVYQRHTLFCRLLLIFLIEQVCLFGRIVAVRLECPLFSPWYDD